MCFHQKTTQAVRRMLAAPVQRTAQPWQMSDINTKQNCTGSCRAIMPAGCPLANSFCSSGLRELVAAGMVLCRATH